MTPPVTRYPSSHFAAALGRAATPADAGYADDAWPFVTMLLLLLAVGAATWAVTLVWTAWVMHRPPRMTAGRALARLGRASPGDVGLAFEEQLFDIADAARPGQSIQLAAWWVPHPAGPAVRRCCVMLHGYGDSRAGSLAWAGLWQDLGFHLLLLDTRAHGDSNGELSGGGVWERDDLHRVLDRLRQARPAACGQIILFGVSFGGMIAAACAAGRDDVAALVLESPVEGWASATRRYAELLGIPLAGAHDLRLRLAERRLGVSFAEVRPAVTLPNVRCPTLAILPAEDVLVSPEESQAIASIVGKRAHPSRAWRVASHHNLALADDPTAYERELRCFLEASLGNASGDHAREGTESRPVAALDRA